MKFRWILCLLVFVFILPSASITQPRDTGKVYRVGILPFIIHSQENLDYLREGIHDILSSRITVEGRIIIVERSLVERALYEMRPSRLDEPVAKELGTRVGADYIVLGSVTKIGNYISLDARLISVSEEKPPLGVYTQHKGIDDVMVKIGDFAQDIGFKILGRRATTGRPEERHPFLIQPERRLGRIAAEGQDFKKSQTFPFEMKGLDIGDVDGDKKNEIVVMDNHNLYIFKYDGDKLNLFLKIEHGFEHNFLTLDVADVNRNGFAEIIVTSVVEDDLRSFILEFEEGKMKKITEKTGWYFRVLEHPKEGPLLMGQRMGSDGLFSGSIYRFVWKKRAFERGPKLPLPSGTKVFGVAMAYLRGHGNPDLIFIDHQDYLNVFSLDGKKVWRSGSRFGGTDNFYDTPKKKEVAFRPQDAPLWRAYIPGRILIRDLDGDGIPEVIINKNEFVTGTFFQRLRTYESAEIYNLVWQEDTLLTNWKTREIKGYIADFQIKDADNDGQVELVMATAPPQEEVTGFITRQSKSNILFLKLF